MPQKNFGRENGNVLFLILIAVALFAALSYAVTQSTRSGGGDASKETNLINASTMTQQGAAIRSAVTRMMTSGTASAEELLFDPPSIFSSLTADEISREVFHPQGGGAIYQEGWIVQSGFGVTNVGLTTGTPLEISDIVAVKQVPVSICRELNKKLGITISDADMEGNMDIVTFNFSNNMDKDHPGINGGGDAFWGVLGSTNYAAQAPYDGKHQGCFYNGASDVHIYYDVIVAR